MRRPHVLLLIGAGVILFLVVSTLLARALSVGGTEDSAITDLITAEARGDRAALVSGIDGCRKSAACQARATAVTTALAHPGSVSIVQIQSSVGFSLGSTLGTARVAWIVGSSLPRVQCVRVRHAGNVLAGFSVQLLEISARIPSTHSCPAKF